MLFAGEGTDYTAVSMTATFDPSSVSMSSTVMACVNINITDDSTGEPLKQFSLVVEPVDPSGRIKIKNGTIAIIIQDNECEYKSILYSGKLSREKTFANL